MTPARAFLYNPLGSRSSTTLRGASTKTSMKSNPAFSCNSLASWRSALYGEIKAVQHMQHESANNLATWCRLLSVLSMVIAMRQIIWMRSVPRRFDEYSRFETSHQTQDLYSTRTWRYLHLTGMKPSSSEAGVVQGHTRSSTVASRHDKQFLKWYQNVGKCTFPLALRPVNQIVTPFWPRRLVRSDASTDPIPIGDGGQPTKRPLRSRQLQPTGMERDVGGHC